jgi:hypothetical protein
MVEQELEVKQIHGLNTGQNYKHSLYMADMTTVFQMSYFDWKAVFEEFARTK